MLPRCLTTYLAVATVALFTGGCATWVNIPAETGDVAGHDPNISTVLKIELQSLRTLTEEIDPDAKVVVLLPPGSTPVSYEQVVPKVGPKASWSTTPPAPAALVLDMRQVRVRGSYAQVDAVQPASPTQPEGPKQLTTVYLHYDIVAGWHVTSVHHWQIPLEQALLKSQREADLNSPPGQPLLNTQRESEMNTQQP